MHGTCPNCGYCPHCGRGGQQFYPYPEPWPWWRPTSPPYPWRVTWSNESGSIGTDTQTITNMLTGGFD